MCRVFVDADPRLWESQTRSIRMTGMVTSVRLENMFWTVLENIAARDNTNVPQLISTLYSESIDEGHCPGNFTSFLRVCCLRFIDLQLRGMIPTQHEPTAFAPCPLMKILPVDEILKSEKQSTTVAQRRL